MSQEQVKARNEAQRSAMLGKENFDATCARIGHSNPTHQDLCDTWLAPGGGREQFDRQWPNHP